LAFGIFLLQSLLNLTNFCAKVKKMLAQIHVTFKEGVLDPQGKTVHHALTDLGYEEVLDVNIGKYMEIKLDSASKEEAEIRVQEMCERLLANTVIESFRFNIVPTE
jgi:phosphoribosylformylglycinamidine synthase subunit PurS